MKKFTNLSLSEAMLENLEKLKYIEMTPVQEQSIPIILKGLDLMAQAKTGSGKTAAFGIGLLEGLDLTRYRVQGLVLCPTRELAEQVSGELRRLARFQHNIKIVTITGGIPMQKQELSLNHQAHIVVGTPGRIQKLLNRESLVLDELKTLVLDEADRMLDLGFIDQINEILSFAPLARQTLCFSATFSEQIKTLAKAILMHPETVEVESHHDERVISQHFYRAQGDKKVPYVLSILAKNQPDSTIIFCNTKDACRNLSGALTKTGVYNLCLNGDLEQKERTEILIRFANGSSRILIATDVAARGLDLKDLSLVLNYDLPFDTETYVHRIGRTGRAGKTGLAVSIMGNKEDFRLELINELLSSDYSPEELELKSDTTKILSPPEMVTLSINGGRKNKISAGDLLGALTAKGGLKGKDIGKINRLDYLCFVAVKRPFADDALKMMDEGTIKGRRFKAIINQ